MPTEPDSTMNSKPDQQRDDALEPLDALQPWAGGANTPSVNREGRGWRVIESLVVFTVGVALMGSIYWGKEGLPGHDSFYHVKMATIIPEHGFLRELPWLRFTYFSEEGHAFVEHHHGFHLLLVPFVTISHWMTGDYLPGARWAMAVFFGITMMLLSMLLLTAGVRWRWIWLGLFVLMPFQFFTRHAYVRAISPSLVFMLLITLLMFRRRYVLTGVAVAGYVHLYLGGVLYAPVLVVLHVVACAVGPREDRGVPWRLILWAAGGWSVGVLTHPYLGGMFEFLKLQVFGSGLSPDISVGREWRPYEGVWWFAQMSGILLTVWAVAACLRFRLGPRIGACELTLLLAHFLFLALTFKARRFIEYWPVFCLLSAAFLTAPAIESLAQRCDRLVDPHGLGRARWIRRATAAVLLLAMTSIVWATPPWDHIRDSVRCDYNLGAIQEAMSFLKLHSQPGDVVFTDDWDVFPVYFYYNSHNYYVVGLDPKFTQFREPALWERYVRITRGQTPAYLSVVTRDHAGKEHTEKIHVKVDDIRDRFGAKFVITDRDHKPFAAKLADRGDFATLIYPSTSYSESCDAPYLIFRVRELGQAASLPKRGYRLRRNLHG